jgi:septal ring factor EnvC (AmiA/AmiB activator)
LGRWPGCNGRQHEGIDIFATKHTPAIATNDGVVERVGENNLGGKVVFMRPDGRDYNLYYAHLDLQLVRDGQVVHAGDTLGLTGKYGQCEEHAFSSAFRNLYLGRSDRSFTFCEPRDQIAKTGQRITFTSEPNVAQ